MGEELTVTVAPRGGRSLRELLYDAGIRLQSDCGGAGTCGKCRVHVLDAKGRRSVLSCQHVPTAPVAVKLDRTAPVGQIIDPGRARRREASGSLHLAADIGTTTISLAAVDVERRRVAVQREELNPQIVFGADVISRIAAGRRLGLASLAPVLLDFARDAGIPPSWPVVAVGNTVMAHFVLGRSAATLGEFPYESSLPMRESLTGQRYGLWIRMLPLLGAFVGSDCTASILASGMHRTRQLSLLVDAGTNGEVVLGNRERMLVTSTAAGPAFEGATLECGSLAQAGAIRAVRHDRDRFRPDVVGGGEAKSICGSGVLDAVAEGVRVGKIEASGRIVGSARLDVSTGPRPVFLSQSDIREVQLAKGAIAAAIRVLLAEWRAGADEIERVHITGRFGASMNSESAARIGLLPPVRPDRIRRYGNLALLGAVKATLDPELFGEAERLAANCREVMLSSHPQFEQAFVNAMVLEPWN